MQCVFCSMLNDSFENFCYVNFKVDTSKLFFRIFHLLVPKIEIFLKYLLYKVYTQYNFWYYVKFKLVETAYPISTNINLLCKQQFHQCKFQCLSLKIRASGNCSSGNSTSRGPPVFSKAAIVRSLNFITVKSLQEARLARVKWQRLPSPQR